MSWDTGAISTTLNWQAQLEAAAVFASDACFTVWADATDWKPTDAANNAETERMVLITFMTKPLAIVFTCRGLAGSNGL